MFKAGSCDLMNFKGHGFLGEDIRSDRPMIKRYPDLFAGARLLNEAAHALLLRIPSRIHEAQNVLVTALFTRILASFASTVYLAEVGLSSDAGSCARTAIEAHFFLRKCIRDSDWAATFIRSDLRDKASYINGLLNISKKERKTYVRDTKRMEQRLQEVKKAAEKLGVQEIIVGNVAAAVDLGPIYSSAYKSLSQICTHVTPMCLLNFVTTDEKNEINGLKYGPVPELADVALYWAIHALQTAMLDITAFHSIDVNDLKPMLDKLAEHLAAHAKLIKNLDSGQLKEHMREIKLSFRRGSQLNDDQLKQLLALEDSQGLSTTCLYEDGAPIFGYIYANDVVAWAWGNWTHEIAEFHVAVQDEYKQHDLATRLALRYLIERNSTVKTFHFNVTNKKLHNALITKGFKPDLKGDYYLRNQFSQDELVSLQSEAKDLHALDSDLIIRI